MFLDQPLCNEDYLCLGNRSTHRLGVFPTFKFCMSTDNIESFFSSDPTEVPLA